MALTLDAPAVKKERICSLQKLRNNLPAEDQSILDGWIENKITPYKIFMALKRDGHAIGRQVVYEHMSGCCICDGA
jgi:hypothetical protein